MKKRQIISKKKKTVDEEAIHFSHNKKITFGEETSIQLR